MRQHLHVDAGHVHLGDAALPDIVETRGDLGLPCNVGTGDVGLHLGVEIMLLEGDDLGFCRHFLLPAAKWSATNLAVCISQHRRRQADSSIARAGSLSGGTATSPGRCCASS